MQSRGQGSLEYLLIIGGGILLAILIIAALLGLFQAPQISNEQLLANAQCGMFLEPERCNNTQIPMGTATYQCGWLASENKCVANLSDVECTGTEQRCDPTNPILQQCNNGTWTDQQNCGTLGCNTDRLECNECQNNARQCTATNDAVESCQNGEWQTTQTCRSGCSNGQCNECTIELCNGVDDDCDSEVDEALCSPTNCEGPTPPSCGNGSNGCQTGQKLVYGPAASNICNASGQCSQNNCTITCQDDTATCPICSTQPNGTCTPGCTNDPDCCTSGSQNCGNGIGVCDNAGTQTCSNGTWSACDYSQVPNYQATETLCDGFDNDCDGTVNGLTQNCPLTEGVCAGLQQTCTNTNSTWPGCSASEYSNWATSQGNTYEDGSETRCSDNQDNDCDGTIDMDDTDCMRADMDLRYCNPLNNNPQSCVERAPVTYTNSANQAFEFICTYNFSSNICSGIKVQSRLSDCGPPQEGWTANVAYLINGINALQIPCLEINTPNIVLSCNSAQSGSEILLQPTGFGIQIRTQNTTVQNCYIRGGTAGISISGSQANPASNNQIVFNRIDQSQTQLSAPQIAIWVSYGGNNRIQGNTIINTTPVSPQPIPNYTAIRGIYISRNIGNLETNTILKDNQIFCGRQAPSGSLWYTTYMSIQNIHLVQSSQSGGNSCPALSCVDESNPPTLCINRQSGTYNPGYCNQTC